MATSLFDAAAEQLERRTRMDRLEARGTLRLAVRNAGLDAQTVSIAQLRAVFEKLMPKELESRGIANAAATCSAVIDDLSRHAIAGEPDASTTPDEIFKRLGRV